MNELSIKQKDFIEYMTQGADLERHGFERLKNHSAKELFFDELKEKGFFDPSKNPAPIESSEEGFYQVPYWPALDYLEAIATLANESQNETLAKKVMDVVRVVSQDCAKDKSKCDNFHTFRVFAKIIGLVPLSIITDEDIDLIPSWLKGRFDRGLVSRELASGIIPNLLNSDDSNDWDKAVSILRYCTAINWETKKSLGGDKKEPHTIITDHYLEKIFVKNIELYAEKVAEKAADVLLERLRETFEKRDTYGSWLRRAAIENHRQNHSFYKTENLFVEGLRDILLLWTKNQPKEAKAYIGQLMSDQSEIVRRVAIYVVDENWKELKGLYTKNLKPDLFQSGHTHELYHLLANNFENFPKGLKKKTFEAIAKIPLPSHTDNPNLSLKYKQRNWLSAIYKKGYQPADTFFEQLSENQELGSLSDHPDFLSYSSGIISGFGDSPYTAEELVAFIGDGTLISKLNSFEQNDPWRGSTTRSLVDTLAKAVQLEPKVFLAVIDTFKEANRSYQYGVISGFKKLWDSADKAETETAVDWEQVWSKLVSFFKYLILNDKFWTEETIEGDNMTPTRAWIPSLVSDFIQSGTRSDEHSYSPDLLPDTWELVTTLVEKSDAAEDAATSDAMSQAINTEKGRAIEAMFNHALRYCRVSDQQHNKHDEIWEKMRPIFDREIAKCKNDNYEFSTLTAAYIANLMYINTEWVEDNFKEIFNADYLSNYQCALGGLAYASANKDIYDLLLKHDVVEFSLKKNIGGEIAKEKLIERMALAYLWGTEDIKSPRFSYLFSSSMASELTMISDVFHSVYEEDLPEDIIERVLSFWKECISWADKAKPEPTYLLSSLSKLSIYLKTIDEDEEKLLVAVTPFVKVNYNADRFIEQLYRLADTSSKEVCSVLDVLLESYTPYYDYEDTFKNLIKKIAEKGYKSEAIVYTEKLKDSLPGMLDLYREMVA